MLAEAEELLKARELDKAWAAYESAQNAGADPDQCSGGRWIIAMLRGDFEVAWQESDTIRARGFSDPNRFWNGEAFDGRRIILRCLHGYGDTIQLIRYASMITARAESLVVEVAPAMAGLVTSFNGVDKVITWGANAPETPPEWDLEIEINELPYIFRTRMSDLPLATKYLNLPKSVIQEMRADPSIANSLRVGVVWASGQWNTTRSVPAPLLEQLFSVPGVEFWNLQGGPSRAEWETFPIRPYLHDSQECATNILLLAALIAKLDLVITPDTLAAHLAGSLGTPAWVLLEHAADWRWQHERRDSPWYPSLRLFRQPTPRDWQTVIEAVRCALLQLAASRIKQRSA